MATEERGVSPTQLDGFAKEAYYTRQSGRIHQWTAKLAGLKSMKLEGLDSLEANRIKSDINICEQEITRIKAEMDLAEKVGSPGQARQELKHPAKLARPVRL